MTDRTTDGMNEHDQLRELVIERNRLDALRPPCPTCVGTGRLGHTRTGTTDDARTVEIPCPDCVDGRMPTERGWRIVAAVFTDQLAVDRWTLDYLRSIR